MKVAGIIAEYNPFHNGHKYHIEKTRELTGADYCIAVISGDFVQRGAPAVIDKFVRTETALQNGIDLVLEMPVVCSTGNAGVFAKSGVSILSSLGVVTDLSFGCETSAHNEKDLLHMMAEILQKEPEPFKKILSNGIISGLPYPAAREKALLACLSTDYAAMNTAKELLSGPNNILALEYLQARDQMNPEMKVCMVTREGASYHDEHISHDVINVSATAIRKALIDTYHADSGNNTLLLPDILSSCMPQEAIELIDAYLDTHRFVSEEDFCDLLFLTLRKEKKSLSERYLNDPFLTNTVCNKLEFFTGWDSFVLACKGKNQTYTSVSRFLAQVLLDLDDEMFSLASSEHFAPYARVLGFRKSAAPLIAAIKEGASIPFITHPAKGLRHLTASQKRLFEADIFAGDLYSYVSRREMGNPISELRRPLIYLP